MNKDKQIEEMAKYLETVFPTKGMVSGLPINIKHDYKAYAELFHNAGYRKIYDDHQRQCACYALGCQMAEELKKKVASEIFEEIGKLAKHSADEAKMRADKETNVLLRAELRGQQIGGNLMLYKLAELKKKYTEGGE